MHSSVMLLFTIMPNRFIDVSVLFTALKVIGAFIWLKKLIQRFYITTFVIYISQGPITQLQVSAPLATS